MFRAHFVHRKAAIIVQLFLKKCHHMMLFSGSSSCHSSAEITRLYEHVAVEKRKHNETGKQLADSTNAVRFSCLLSPFLSSNFALNMVMHRAISNAKAFHKLVILEVELSRFFVQISSTSISDTVFPLCTKGFAAICSTSLFDRVRKTVSET